MNTANIDTEHIHCVPAMYELSNDIKANVAEQVVYKMMQRKFYIYFLFYLLIVVFWKATTNQNPVHKPLSISSFETYEQDRNMLQPER